MMHGLFASSENFVMNGEKSPALILAKKGYDVWCGNHRGTKYANKHIKFDADKDEKYWDFSFTEMGDFDLPKSIEYVLSETKQDKLAYIGHSLGTTCLFHGLATNEEYWKNKIRVFIPLAPVCMPNKYFPLFNFGHRVEKSLTKFLKFMKLWDLFGKKWQPWCRLFRTFVPGVLASETS